VPTTLSTAFYGPSFWLCTLIIVKLQHGYDEIAAFTVANQWRSIAIFIPGILGQSILPIITNLTTNMGRTKSIIVLRYIFKHLFFISSITTIILCIFSYYIMSFYGKDYKSYWLVFCILQIAVFLQIIQSPIIKYIESNGDIWYLCFFNFIQGLIMIIFTYILSNLAALGLAISVLISFMIHSIWLYYYIKKEIIKYNAN
jgi:O-antigen/teichoic acid export membrane protein